ncbi:hypothetical protein C2S52_012205 [Perilla frutescens var. hirtella]|nr:hypothetical protein C2S52_012205 [Perilla frutescens var. hirtella]
MAKKGTVTELSSLFPAEEAQKASRRVQDEIAERRRQLDQLQGFLDDNSNLINLVWKLPDETHHNIMVPFGKAAFFPGRMTNPNKFLVLLGESYFAERSAKQTVEILERRSNTLETQIDSLNAIIDDLKLEASFFDNTARESAEGLVEIREDYIEEVPSGTSPNSGKKSDSVPLLEVDNGKAAIEDEEYAHIFSRMTELEKEEEEAEEANGSDHDEQIQNEQDQSVGRDSTDQEVRNIPIVTREAPVISKEGASHGDYHPHSSAVVKKDFKLPQEEKIGSPLPASNTVKKDFELPQDEKIGSPLPARNTVKKDFELPQDEKIGSPLPASNTAFTGSIVEHAHNIGMHAPQQQARGSKPVSRFKMQRK